MHRAAWAPLAVDMATACMVARVIPLGTLFVPAPPSVGTAGSHFSCMRNDTRCHGQSSAA